MQEIWDRIEAWLRAHVPWQDYAEGFGCIPLPGGADENLIWAIEQMLTQTVALRIRFPEDLRKSYLIHNGCNAAFAGADMLRVENIPQHLSIQLRVNDWLKSERGRDRESIKTTGPMKNQAWDPGWIPLTDVGGPSYMCVDFSPAEGGHVGQVIHVDTEMRRGHVLATGFKEWLSTFADELENGYFYWDESLEQIGRLGGRLFDAPQPQPDLRPGKRPLENKWRRMP